MALCPDLTLFFVSNGWEGYFSNAVQLSLPRHVFDHFSILDDAGGILSGPSPF